MDQRQIWFLASLLCLSIAFETSCSVADDCPLGECFLGKCTNHSNNSAEAFHVDSSCTSDKECNQGVCKGSENGSHCLCEASKWKGKFCEVAVQSCSSKDCSYRGICSLNSSTGSIACTCDDGYQGDRCQKRVLAFCGFAADLSLCHNGGSCVDGRCECKDGFSGEACKTVAPPLALLRESGCPDASFCSSHFKDGHCDSVCLSGSCLWDGDDCMELSEDLFSKCIEGHKNSRCDPECNIAPYGFDGGDCGDKGVRQKSVLLTLVFREHPHKIFLYFNHLRALLARTLHTSVDIDRDRDGNANFFSYGRDSRSREQLPWNDGLKASSGLFPNTQLILRVSLPECGNGSECLPSAAAAVSILNLLYVTPSIPLEYDRSLDKKTYNFTLLEVQVEPEQSNLGAYLVLASLCLALFSVVLLFLAVFFFCSYRAKKRSMLLPTTTDWAHPGDCPLLRAVRAGDLPLISSILATSGPAAAQAEDSAGNSVLHLAAARDDTALLSLLLSSQLFDVCSVNSIGQSPLLYSIREGRPSLECLSLLVCAIDAEKRRHRLASPSLPYTSCQSALSEESGWSLTDSAGRCCVHYAGMAGLFHLIPFLVSHGASPSLPDYAGNTPMHLAAVGGHRDTVIALLEERASCTAVNHLGNTPAQIALMNGHHELASLLFSREHQLLSPLRPTPPLTESLSYGERLDTLPDMHVTPSLEKKPSSGAPSLPPILTPSSLLLSHTPSEATSTLSRGGRSGASSPAMFAFPAAMGTSVKSDSSNGSSSITFTTFRVAS